MPLMMDFARALRDELGELPPAECYQVPTGSGETITCLRWAYPDLHFVAVYNQGRPTQFEKKAPLNLAVAAMGPIQYHPAPVSPESKKISC